MRYHISYDQNLTFKDLEDMLNLIRISNNDVFSELGIPRAVGNSLQRIENVENGSITLVAALGVISACITIGDFVWKVGRVITKKIEAEHNRNLTGTRKDKKVYYRNEVSVRCGEQTAIFDNNRDCVMYIHIYNADDIGYVLEI